MSAFAPRISASCEMPRISLWNSAVTSFPPTTPIDPVIVAGCTTMRAPLAAM